MIDKTQINGLKGLLSQLLCKTCQKAQQKHSEEKQKSHRSYSD